MMTQPHPVKYVPTTQLFWILAGLILMGLTGFFSDVLVSVWLLSLLLVGTLLITEIFRLARCHMAFNGSRWSHQPSVHTPLQFFLLMTLQAPARIRYRIQAIDSDIFRIAPEPQALEQIDHNQMEATWTLWPRKRGDCQWPGAYVIWRSRLHLLEKWEQLPEVTIPVYPKLSRDIRSKLDPEFLMQQMGIKSSRWFKADQEFDSMRPYVAGDDYRHIDWKASARMRGLITRQFRVEHHHQILICLDTSRLMGTRWQNISKLDWAIEACLHLAYLAKRFEDKIGLLTFSNKVDHWVNPKHEPVETFLKTLYNVNCHMVEADFYQTCMAVLSRQKKRSLVIFLSDFLDAGSMEPWMDAFSFLNRKHCTLFIGVEDPAYRRHMELDDLDNLSAADISRSLVAVDSMKRRKATLNRLRYLGLHALTVTPDQLVSQAMEAYSKIKLQGAI